MATAASCSRAACTSRWLCRSCASVLASASLQRWISACWDAQSDCALASLSCSSCSSAACSLTWLDASLLCLRAAASSDCSCCSSAHRSCTQQVCHACHGCRSACRCFCQNACSHCCLHGKAMCARNAPSDCEGLATATNTQTPAPLPVRSAAGFAAPPLSLRGSPRHAVPRGRLQAYVDTGAALVTSTAAATPPALPHAHLQCHVALIHSVATYRPGDHCGKN